jgi:Bacterial protein of unknown function (DUF839)
MKTLKGPSWRQIRRKRRIAKTSIRRLVRPQPLPYERFLDVLRRGLSQRKPPSMPRRRVPLLVLRTCEAHFYFGLLEMGGLHAARFDDDGTGEGLPLTFGQGPLPTANDLALQADILINTRRSLAPLGAIAMEALDRIAAKATNGKVYGATIHNSPRTRERAAHVKHRGPDHYGQVSECTEDKAGGSVKTFTWVLFFCCGGPSDGACSTYVAGLNPQLISPVPSPINSSSRSATTYGSLLPIRPRHLGRRMASTTSRLQDRGTGICVNF